MFCEIAPTGSCAGTLSDQLVALWWEIVEPSALCGTASKSRSVEIGQGVIATSGFTQTALLLIHQEKLLLQALPATH